MHGARQRINPILTHTLTHPGLQIWRGVPIPLEPVSDPGVPFLDNASPSLTTCHLPGATQPLGYNRPSVPLICCVTSGKLLHLADLQFLQIIKDGYIYLTRLQ